ncbi:hypothetical protein COT75_02065 [Candidatus Beckwithbacteria bacterium CG10_big_fil_rev_8_21_14_0_10_34_10]|uniref:Dihydrofolate reductase n=1 Tax=Candidatus Beckwithbacteria bacterium CG10_big_fil_rev_8_21_14_0_10_34_10 TaxID=1974495 RepID=A0A2H0W9V9_9BACT|nr:MAG: hypothetical protein COT75_02065 [Candidatus Beckwithbacteria bacterium CG10_big_fil_rev_8_21_14_0_10_34_10]
MTQFTTPKKPIISLIAAIGENRELGYQGKIPWHIKEDFIYFKKKTLGHVIIMGRKTFDSLLKFYKKGDQPLPKRIIIIITRNKDYQVIYKDCFVVHSIKQAIQLAKEKEKTEIFISGGGQIYEKGIKLADKLYLTIVKGKFKADTFFPDYSRFKKAIKEDKKESGGYRYSFLELKK